MESQNLKEYLNSFNYNDSEKPAIEIICYEKGDEHEFTAFTNGVVSFMEGRARYEFKNYPAYEAAKGEMIFIPVGTLISFKILERCKIVVFRLYNRIKLYEYFFIDKLFSVKNSLSESQKSVSEQQIYHLAINSRIQLFFEGLIDCINDGLKSKYYFDMKIEEFFILIRSYYITEQIHDFLLLMFSNNIAFSEFIKQNWNRYRTVAEIAESMNMTLDQFSKKFKEVFGKPANKWLKENKAAAIYSEIISCDKPLQQIALDYGFNTMTQFIRFCKIELGKTPMEIYANPSNIVVKR